MADKTILVSSGFGSKHRKPFVVIESEDLDKPLQISPDDARNLAMNLLRAAEAADHDAFVVGFLKDQADLNDEQIAAWLYEFRVAREKIKHE